MLLVFYIKVQFLVRATHRPDILAVRGPVELRDERVIRSEFFIQSVLAFC